jgi:hypothetical protein
MVDVMVECTKMRRILLLARDKNYKGNLETIMETIDHKKAQYLFYNLADLQDKDLKSDFLFGAKEAMENGFFLILNLDFKTFAKKSEFNTSHHELTDYLSLGFLNRDSSAILKEFDSAGIEPPELIHPEFLVRTELTLGRLARRGPNRPRRFRVQTQGQVKLQVDGHLGTPGARGHHRGLQATQNI